MDIFFRDPDEVPLPPQEVRIQTFEMTPWPDGRPIVKVTLHVTPFQRRPSAEIHVFNPQGEEVAEASILGAMAAKSEINLHLRGAVPSGEYTAHCRLYYERYPEGQSPAQGEGNTYTPPEIMVVDERQTRFTL